MRPVPLAVLIAGCSSHPAAAVDAAPQPQSDAPPPGPMRYVRELINGDETYSPIDVPIDGAQPGDAVLFQIFNGDPAPAPTTYTITGQGWTFTELGTTPTGAVFAAIVPPDPSLRFTVTSTSPGQLTWINADELANTDPRGGTVTFDAVATASCPCSQTCTTSLVTGHDADLIWAGLVPGYRVQPGPGFTQGGSFGDGPRTAYMLTADPAGTTETVAMTATSSPAATCTVTAIAIKPY